MKKVVTINGSLLILLMSICSGIFAQEDSALAEPIVRNNVLFAISEVGEYSLTIEIAKLKSDDGIVMLSLVNENDKHLAGAKAPIIDRKCSIRIDSLQAGNYAIRYYHDKNNNGELDTGAFGIPNEGYGFSNNARGFMGPPDFDDMIFKLEENITIELKTVN